MGSAVVVGGGIGGVAAAAALHKIGWDVRLVERAPAFGEVGAGITLFANAQAALDAIGVGDRLRGGPSRRLSGVRKRDGRWLFQAEMTSADFFAVHRADLHAALLSAVPEEARVTGAEATAIDPAGLVHVGDEQLKADVIVAADGAASRARATLFPGWPGLTYSGMSAWRGVTATSFPDDLPNSQTWDAGVELGVVPLVDGRVYWYVGVHEPEGRTYPDDHAELLRRYGDWLPEIHDVLSATDPAAVLHHDVRHLPVPLRSYVNGRVALLGDAAHAMTPYLGQGAAQALEDAVTLASVLADEPHVETALDRYDRERRPRSQEVARASAMAGHTSTLLRNPLAIMLRDTAIRLLPARTLVNSVQRYARWTAPHLPSPMTGNGRT